MSGSVADGAVDEFWCVAVLDVEASCVFGWGCLAVLLEAAADFVGVNGAPDEDIGVVGVGAAARVEADDEFLADGDFGGPKRFAGAGIDEGDGLRAPGCGLVGVGGTGPAGG